MLKIRVSFDKPVDLTPLLDEIHNTFGDALYNSAQESTPVETGRTWSSWHKTRTDENTTSITNDSMVGSYQILSLLHDGTRPHRVGMFAWRAAGYANIIPGLKVHIDPFKIAIKAVKSTRGLQDADVPKTRWEAVQFYSYREDLTRAIEEGTELAVRRMNVD